MRSPILLYRSQLPKFLVQICLLLAFTLSGTVEVSAASPFTVVIIGVDGALLENLSAALTLPNGLVRDGRVEPVWARRFARQSQERARKALEPFGYYAADVATELIVDDDGSYRLNVAVTPGEPVRVSQRRVQLSGAGAEEAQLHEQLQKFPLAVGAPMRHDLYEKAKGELLASAIELGYLDAYFVRHEVRLSRQSGLAEIDLQLESGPRYRFGEVTFSGADDFPPAVLRRYLAFTPGKPFSAAKLSRTQANLLDADKFRSIRVIADPDQAADQSVPIQVVLVPQARYQLRPGLGYGTDTGPRATLRFQNINAFHLGHELQADLLYAELNQKLSGRYLIPLTDRLDSLLGLSLQYRRELNDTFDSSSLQTEASLTHVLASDYKVTLFLNLSQENYQVGAEESRVTTLLMPGIRLSKRHWTFDSPGRVRAGYSWQTEVRGASATLGSDVSLLQGLISASAILPLPWQSQLLLRGEGGATLQDDFADLPASMRFFAGGDQSVRGYAYRSLGPQGENGDVIGGRHLAVGSLELERRLLKNWGLAIFYDSGNAFDDLNNFVLAHGAGIGLRRYTQIGPIRLDLARQLGDGNAFRLHLSVGFVW